MISRRRSSGTCQIKQQITKNSYYLRYLMVNIS
jgi:hypothetical protein